MILTLTMVLFTSVAIMREREAGNLEFLITTPVQTAELMVGKIVPYVMIGFVQVTRRNRNSSLAHSIAPRSPILS